MKKQFLISVIGIFSFSTTFAQLNVLENGNVGIKNSNPESVFTIGNNYGSEFSASIEGDYVGLEVNTIKAMPYTLPNGKGYWGMGIESKKDLSQYQSSRGDIGIIGTVRSVTTLNKGRALGVVGVAQNATNGYNNGVVGAVMGTQDGAGIVGLANGTYLGAFVSGQYAGFFDGDVKITGELNGTVISSSDMRLKQNIVDLGNDGVSLQNASSSKTSVSVLDGVLQLRPVQYNFKQVYFDNTVSGDTTNVDKGYFNEESQQFQKLHYGLIAQEVQELYPELVYEGSDGYLSIDYIGLIPLLIQSVKELNAKIDVLEQEENNIILKSISTRDGLAPTESDAFNDRAAVLYQNTPNPFTQTTGIRYYLPQNVGTASLCIYDMQGKQLKQIPLIQRGEGTELISASQLAPGMYLYALIADGQEVDLKRMILTE